MPAGVKGCWCLGLWRYGLKVLGLEALEFRAPEVSRGFSGSMVLNMMIAVLLLVISDIILVIIGSCYVQMGIGGKTLWQSHGSTLFRDEAYQHPCLNYDNE